MKVLSLPVPPAANRYWRNFRGRMVKSKEARLYREAIWQLAFRWRKHLVPAGQKVAVRIVWTRRKRIGDLDNRLKVLLDSLQGIAWEDDKQVSLLEAVRVDGDHDAMDVVWCSVPDDASSAACYLDRPWPWSPTGVPSPDAPVR